MRLRVCVGMGTEVRHQPEGAASLLPLCGPRHLTQVTKLGSKGVYLPNHRTGTWRVVHCDL